MVNTIRTFAVVLMALAVLNGIGWIDVGPVPPPTPVDPDVDPVDPDPPGPKPIDAPGLNVLVVPDEGQMTVEQVVVIGEIQKRVLELGGDYEKIDTASGLEHADPKWRAAFEELNKRGPPGWVVSSDKGGDYFKIPDRPEHAMETLMEYAE